MLKLMDIKKTYESASLLDGISMAVMEAEIVCLLGASGSGKSTLLRIIAGLESPEAGQVMWNGEDLASIPTYKRNFGLMFQDYALFPFLNVAENVSFGLKMQHLSNVAIQSRIAEVLQQVDLSGFDKRKVTDLSGGEQQRVALARVLAPQPRLLMFDEPLGALDRNLRETLLVKLRTILKQSRVPVIFVTHDQEEAFALADRILLLHDGRIVRSGKSEEVWDEPGSAWAARFLGLGNIITGRWLPDGRVDTTYGVFQANICQHTHKSGDPVSLLVRPELSDVPSGNRLEGVVTEVLFHHNNYRVIVNDDLFFYLPYPPNLGETLRLDLSVDRVQCL
jgi:spermidine/putrescine transport system ATP-binding protein